MIHWEDPVWTLVFGGGYLGLVSLQWLLLIAGVSQYGRHWRMERPTSKGEPLPSVSVCIPARNEEANIGPCVEAVFASEQVELEVIVLDDSSEDRTSDAAREAAGRAGGESRFHLLGGRERPEGWAGKTWAVSQAAAHAAHDFLMFVDADVILDPLAIHAALARLEKDKLDLLSCFGTWRLDSFWEEALIPVVGWLIRGATNLDRVNDPARQDAFANGQFILVRRSTYERLGGHGLVKNEVLEDVRLARAYKQKSARIGLFVAPWAFRVRLYHNLREILSGYTKNLYEGMGRAPHLALGLVISIFVGAILPFLLFGGAIATRLLFDWHVFQGFWLVWLGGICTAILALRWRIDRIDGRSPRYFWTYPLGIVLLAWIVLQSMFRVEVEWKGRAYKDGKA